MRLKFIPLHRRKHTVCCLLYRLIELCCPLQQRRCYNRLNMSVTDVCVVWCCYSGEQIGYLHSDNDEWFCASALQRCAHDGSRTCERSLPPRPLHCIWIEYRRLAVVHALTGVTFCGLLWRRAQLFSVAAPPRFSQLLAARLCFRCACAVPRQRLEALFFLLSLRAFPRRDAGAINLGILTA